MLCYPEPGGCCTAVGGRRRGRLHLILVLRSQVTLGRVLEAFGVDERVVVAVRWAVDIERLHQRILLQVPLAEHVVHVQHELTAARPSTRTHPV
jgi:hypothetical protein